MDAYRYATSGFPDERWSIQHIRDQNPMRMGFFTIEMLLGMNIIRLIRLPITETRFVFTLEEPVS